MSTSNVVTAVEVAGGKGIFMNQRLLPPLQAHEVEIAPLYSFISQGTELAVLQIVLNAGESSPINRLGYSQSGIITRVGREVRCLEVGDTVCAIGAGAFHATRTILAQNLVTPLPEGIDPKEAALAAMFCFCLEGVRKSNVHIGETVVVLGGGTMGQITARLYQLLGAKVAVMDSNPYRLSFLPDTIKAFTTDEDGWQKLAGWARPYGVEHASICFGGDASATIERLRDHMSRSPDGIPHGRIIFPGGAHLAVTMASNMGNIQFFSSAKAGPGYRDPHYEAGNDYPAAYVGHPVRRNVETMFWLLKTKALGLKSLITHTLAFSEATEAYSMLQQPNVKAIAVLLKYDAAITRDTVPIDTDAPPPVLQKESTLNPV